MTINLVQLVMQYLTPDVIAKIASALGLGRDSAQKAVRAIVPALLSKGHRAAPKRRSPTV